jgi:hypothetical protein
MYQLHFRPVELYLKRIAADARNYRERIEAVENDPSWRSVRSCLVVRPRYLRIYNIRALEREKSRGPSKLARRNCQRCKHICRRVLSIYSVQRLPNVDWDGCRLFLCGCCISSIRQVAIPRTRSSQFDRYIFARFWKTTADC